MALEDTLNSVGGGALNIVIILFVFIIFSAFAFGVIMLVKRQTRFKQFRVIIWEVLASGGLRQSADAGGIFTSGKTGNKLFYLKKAGVGLKPDNVSYLTDSKGKKVVYLMRYGYKNFIFINPMVENGKPVFKVGEEDVNWAINSYEANKKRFSQSLLFQLLPFIVLALISIIILVMMIYLFKQFSVFRDVAASIAEASKQFGQQQVVNLTNIGGNIVSGGGVI